MHNIIISKPFDKEFKKLPKEIRELAYHKIELLLDNPKHSSLRLKKMIGTKNIWEISITMNYRITLEIEKDYILLRKIGPHDILRTP